MRNWDYRYCWLRDASLTLRALFDLGYAEEAEAYLSWILHATRLTWPELQVLYDVFGEAHLPESELSHLSGYANSRPVRVGNDAHGQLQLDVYGEVIDAVTRFVARGGHVDRDTARMLNGLGRRSAGAGANRTRDLGGPCRTLSSHPLQGALLGRAGPADRPARYRPIADRPRSGFALNGTQFGPRSRRRVQPAPRQLYPPV